MPNFSQFTGIGHITRDPEVRQAGSSSVCGFGVAINRKRGNSESTMFVDVSIWGKRGDTASRYLKKGQAVGVTGELYMDEYTSRDGEMKQKLKVDGDFFFVGGKGSNDDGGERADGEITDRDDLPF